MISAQLTCRHIPHWSRSDQTTTLTIGSPIQRISGPGTYKLPTTSDNRLVQLIASGRSNAEIVNELYWSALSRPPSQLETKAALAYLQKSRDLRPALEDLAWSLLNAK